MTTPGYKAFEVKQQEAKAQRDAKMATFAAYLAPLEAGEFDLYYYQACAKAYDIGLHKPEAEHCFLKRWPKTEPKKVKVRLAVVYSDMVTDGKSFGASPDGANGIEFTPFEFVSAEKIPPRDWVYKPIYIRRHVSLTAARGGTGKSSLALVEALAMATGFPLHGIAPIGGPKRVAYWNGEDGVDELQRRIAAICKYFMFDEHAVGDRLFIDSGREMPIKLATMDGGTFKIADPVVDQLIAAIDARGLDVFIVDPYVASHGVSENDTVMQDQIVKKWGLIGERTNVAIGLVHHNRKALSGPQAQIEDFRGASSIIDAARVRRSLNNMTEQQAKDAGVNPDRKNFYVSADLSRSNLQPPATALTWYELESVDLNNATATQESDHIGVPVPWEYKRLAEAPATPEQERGVLDAVKKRERWRVDMQSPEWIGHPIVAALGLLPDDIKGKTNMAKAHRQRVATMIVDLDNEGAITKVQANDANGIERWYWSTLKPSPRTSPVMGDGRGDD